MSEYKFGISQVQVSELLMVMNKVNKISDEFGIKLNIKKTKFVIVTKKLTSEAHLYMKG